MLSNFFFSSRFTLSNETKHLNRQSEFMAWKMLIIVISSREPERNQSRGLLVKIRAAALGTTHICSVAANEKNDLDDELTDFLAVAKRAML